MAVELGLKKHPANASIVGNDIVSGVSINGVFGLSDAELILLQASVRDRLRQAQERTDSILEKMERRRLERKRRRLGELRG
ncbi:MAG: hypothetical protein V3T58_05640 [Candidatus Hydrothermarchaeales archaeon]